MMTTAISVSALTKRYSTRFGRSHVLAVDGVSFQVEPGEIFGLLGPNGAGKTTTVKILLGLTRATSGEASIFGIPVGRPESRRRVGYLPEGHRFPGYLTARATLKVFGRMSGMSSRAIGARSAELLERVRLAEWADVRVKKFSKGMVQRLGLAAALVHDPDVLLLDEPTDGVDPVGRREIRDLLREEAGKGRAILLNSHLLSEIEQTCGRVAILRKGRVVREGRIEELTRRDARFRMVAAPVDEPLLQAFRETGAGVERVNGHLILSVRDLAHVNALVDRLRSEGRTLQELAPDRSTLEDVFVDLVKTDPEPEGSVH
jgi:ABC-2 type transport system ATP-binding protein